ncbi:MAG TPA: aspartate aminotransferase family protein [Cyclobacteriaceae bacterium]
MPTNRQLFLQYLAQTSDEPLALEIEKAEGIYMYDKSGNQYLDLIAGIGVSNVGHRHPEVIAAIREQLDKYLHLMVYGEFIQSPQCKLAEALTSSLPENLNNVYFLNSGSEAVEGALKLAKRYTNRFEIISCYNAYHGSTHGALSVSGSEKFKRNFRPLLSGTKQIPYGSFHHLNQITPKTAAVIIETVQGEAGAVSACSNYFQSLSARCNETGTLLILDEIQCGFGRSGKFWAFQWHDITPDILICAKGMGGGMPIGAFIAPEKIMGKLKNNPVLGHITTFGGHPVSCVASLATINVLKKERLIESVEEKSKIIWQELKHPLIHHLSGKGLLIAAHFDSFNTLKKVISRAIDLGAVTDWFLFNDAAMRIAPPLTISTDQVREACRIILEACDIVKKESA